MTRVPRKKKQLGSHAVYFNNPLFLRIFQTIDSLTVARLYNSNMINNFKTIILFVLADKMLFQPYKKISAKDNNNENCIIFIIRIHTNRTFPPAATRALAPYSLVEYEKETGKKDRPAGFAGSSVQYCRQGHCAALSFALLASD